MKKGRDIEKTRMTTFIKTNFKISNLESPSNFQVKEKNYSNRSIKKKIGLLWSRLTLNVEKLRF